MSEVNKERVALLVEALESGKYEQTTGKLCEGTKHCCLGVACRVAMEGGVDVEIGASWLGKVTFDEEELHLPSKVRRWYGFADEVPDLLWGQGTTPATDINDGGASFPEIAAAFRRTFLEA